MADITPDFNAALKGREAPPVLKHKFDVQRLDSFLQEAYSINASIADLTRQLRAVRPAYLSTAAPPRRRALPGQPAARDRTLTNAERDAIDAESKTLLRELNARISTIKQAEGIRNETAAKITQAQHAKAGLGALGRWAAGGAATASSPAEEQRDAERKSVASHREGVILFLQRTLEEAGRVQSEMMEVRLGREVEKSKSVLYKSRLQGNSIPYAAEDSATSEPNHLTTTQPPSGLSQEQIQLFAEENDSMLRHYESQLDQIATAEKSILEISQLQNTLVQNLEVQGEQIAQLEQDSYNTEENLGRGNKELKKASERKRTAMAVFWSTAAFCAFLVGWDLVF